MFFKKISADDLETRAAWINDPRIHSTMYVSYPTSAENMKQWYAATGSAKDRIDIVVKDAQNKYLGMAGLTSISSVHLNAELYIMINPNLQGKGFGKAITAWMMNLGFVKYNLNKIYLYTDSTNERAYSLYEKFGFVREGIQRQHRFKDGTFRDKVAFGMLREEWMATARSQETKFDAIID